MIAGIAPLTRTSLSCLRNRLSFDFAKRSRVMSSIAWVFTTEIPEIVSWRWFESSPRPSWTSMFQRCKSAPKTAREQHEERIGDENQQRELPVDPKHHRERTHIEQRSLHDREQAGAEEHPHRVEVVDTTTHQIACPPGQEERLGEALQVREEVVAHLVFDLASGIEDENARVVAEHTAQDADPRQPDRQADDGIGGFAVFDGSDGAPREFRHDQEGRDIASVITDQIA